MPKKLKDIHLSEISLVDRGANPGAKVSLYKRDPIAKFDREPLVKLCKGMFDDDASTDFRTALSDEMRNQRVMEINESMFPLMNALRESVMTTAAEMSGEDRDNQIRRNVEAFLQAVRDKLDGESMEKALDTLRKNAPDIPAGSPGTTAPSQKGNAMTVEELQKKLGELDAQVAKQGEQIETLTKERDAEKARADALENGATDAGLKVEKTEDGDITVKKAGAEEETVEFNGVTLKKSECPPAVLDAIQKGNERLAKLEAEREAESLRKRADMELPHLKGTADERAALIKAVDGIEDETTRNAVRESLKAADGFAKAAFAEVGKSVVDDDNSATARLYKLAQDRAAEKGETFETAFAAVTEKGEGAELLQKSRAEQRDQAN